MSSPLKELVRPIVSAGAGDSTGTNLLEYVRFNSAQTNYLVRLDNVREITDMPTITPYPQEFVGHIGLISLRGEILPVLAVDRDPKKHINDKRAIVIEYENGSKLCFPASDIKKIVLDTSKSTTQKTFEIDGMASSIFNIKNLPALEDNK